MTNCVLGIIIRWAKNCMLFYELLYNRIPINVADTRLYFSLLKFMAFRHIISMLDAA